MPGERRRIAYVDGLRAVAVLLVVAHHATKHYPRLLALPAIGEVLRHGNHGVDLFFILSGFCLSYPTLAKIHERGAADFGVVQYAARRVVRIVPPYWIAIALLAVFATVLGFFGQHAPRSMPLNGFSALDVGLQAFFVDRGPKMLNDSFWTLPIEFRWYFVFPLLLWLWVKSPRWFLVAGCAIGALAFALQWSPDLFFLPSFMLGIIAAQASLVRSKIILVTSQALLPIALGLALWFTRGEGAADYRNALFYASAFLFVVAAAQVDVVQRWLSPRWLVAVGVASYSIYLVHNPAIGFFEQRGMNPIFAAVIAVAVGFAFWAAFERIFTETPARDRLTKWLESLVGRGASLHIRHVLSDRARGQCRAIDRELSDVSEERQRPVRTASEPT